MGTEPTEEAIANFVSFTSTTPEIAVRFLKAHNLDSAKAINAYFEDPTPPVQYEAQAYYENQNVPSFKIEHTDPVQGPSYAAPSRPPSRINMHDAGQPLQGPDTADKGNPEKGLSLAEQEERELQQAMAMSLNQEIGPQETGVTSVNPATFGKATRDYYEENAWAMTLIDSSAREIIISPDPEDRKRTDDHPVFIRPSQDSPYLGGLVTILHSIPLARESLLLRSHLLPNYGQDSQWWNGQSINLPKVVTMQSAQDNDMEWDDILYETQRLMAFLDGTNRAFGSSDALVSLKAISDSYGSEGGIGRFLEAWQGAAVRATPDNPLAATFLSRAFKRPLAESTEPIAKEFYTLDPFVDRSHGQTLYDVLDRAVWSDRPGEQLDDVWLEHVADVLTIKLETSDNLANSVDVKIPSIFYPDRYLETNKELARAFRQERLQAMQEITGLETMISRFTMTSQLIYTGLEKKDILQKSAEAAPVAMANNMADSASQEQTSPEETTPKSDRLVQELKDAAQRIETKLNELILSRAGALEDLRKYTKILTEPSESEAQSPQHRYTLRGVCTQPHITYVLRRQASPDAEDSAMTDTKPQDEWQWWRISFSTDDGKTQQAKKTQSGNTPAAPTNSDVVGYTASKVREIEVLRAAREESKSVMLVYATSNAVDAPVEALPSQLQKFVSQDNELFDAEFHPAQDIPIANEEYMEGQIPLITGQTVSSFGEDPAPREEMKERGGPSLLGQHIATATGTPAGTGAVSSSMPVEQRWDGPDDDQDGMADHIEYTK